MFEEIRVRMPRPGVGAIARQRSSIDSRHFLAFLFFFFRALFS